MVGEFGGTFDMIDMILNNFVFEHVSWPLDARWRAWHVALKRQVPERSEGCGIVLFAAF